MFDPNLGQKETYSIIISHFRFTKQKTNYVWSGAYASEGIEPSSGQSMKLPPTTEVTDSLCMCTEIATVSTMFFRAISHAYCSYMSFVRLASAGCRGC